MFRKQCLFLIVLSLLFTCAFDVIVDPVSENNPVVPSEQIPGSDETLNSQGFSDVTEITQNFGEGENPIQTDQTLPGSEQTVDPASSLPVSYEEPLAEPTLPPTEEPQQPTWEGIDEDQLYALMSLYNQMTNTGKTYSGWFYEGDYAPCSWNGISCENGRVTGLSFEKAGYFTTFPESILSFRDLKELHLVDTLVRGTLPETLFADLPKLEKLELKGNYFTGEIPALPNAFEVYPVLSEITLSDNIEDDRKTQLLYLPEYADIVGFSLDPYAYPETDLTPGVDGSLPEDWNRLPMLAKIDLSGNALTGSVSDSFAQLPLSALDLRDNGVGFNISAELYAYFLSFGNPDINLEGLILPQEEEPVPVEEPTATLEAVLPWDDSQQSQQNENEPLPEQSRDVPVEPDQQVILSIPAEVPTEVPTEVPVVVIPTEVPTQVPPTDVPTQVPPTEVPVIPTAVPTQVPPTPQTIIIVVTATPVPQYYTATPQPYYYSNQQPYQPYYYPTATPYTYQQPYYVYPTATPYTYYNPNWVYPTSTSAYTYSYPQYVQNQSPTQVPTLAPTQDQGALLGFTYKLEAMSENNIPMTWRYTGMTDYSINYLDANGNIYPGFAMEWTAASELCNASACNASVSVPDELLKQGKFSLQLRTRDAAGRTYVSEPVEMEVTTAQTAPTPIPEPEQPKSFLAGFFEWLFGPLIRLFKGK